MQSIRTFVHPNGREQVEMIRDGESYGFQLWRREKKRLRIARQRDAPRFASYAEALYAASEEAGWLAKALCSQGACGGYFVEALRGLTFRFTTYEEACFGDHYHCESCGAKLAEADWPGVQHEGYVTEIEGPEGSERLYWEWLCIKCFTDLRDELQLRLE